MSCLAWTMSVMFHRAGCTFSQGSMLRAAPKASLPAAGLPQYVLEAAGRLGLGINALLGFEHDA